ncbi:MAG: HisA/HisF-related TIM barrel protein, partial [Gemmatimonadaceae bacterium]
LLVTSIDREGTGRGFDEDITRRIADAVSIPVIACGGAGRAADVVNVVRRARPQAVCVASLLHYNVVRRGWVEQDFAEEINVAHLRGATGRATLDDCSLVELKAALRAAGIDCRAGQSPAHRAEDGQ